MFSYKVDDERKKILLKAIKKKIQRSFPSYHARLKKLPIEFYLGPFKYITVKRPEEIPESRYVVNKRRMRRKRFLQRIFKNRINPIIKRNKKIFFYDYSGLGKHLSQKLVSVLDYRLWKHITRRPLGKIVHNFKKTDNFKDQKFLKTQSLKALETLRNYRNYRLRKKLPARGQRTHTNAKTRKKRNVK